ncbi:MAG: hypothetical protein HZA77_08055 [Candidatus Schekmanbacteria bacterium]|nr:hypothetical protein [Candidatus Schekmanbacteria bacterium]
MKTALRLKVRFCFLSCFTMLLASFLFCIPLVYSEEGKPAGGTGAMEMKDMDMSGAQQTKTMEGMPGMAGMSHGEGDMIMDDKMVEEMRQAIPQLKGKTDAEIRAGMAMMPKDYEAYISDKSLKGDIGVLVVAHGGGKVWDETLINAVKPIASAFPTVIGFGMCMHNSTHMQASVNDLVAAGAKKIIVVPTALNENTSLDRQWAYIFGKSNKASYATVPQIKTEAKIVIASEMNDNPLVSEIMIDFAKKISTDPKNEVVYIVGHGPEDPADNAKVLEVMGRIAKEVKKDGNYNDVKCINLQDDAPKEIRAGNVQKLRKMIEETNSKKLQPLIIALLMSSRGIQHKIKSDLAGLEYKSYLEGMSTHENFTRWVHEVIQDEIKKN